MALTWPKTLMALPWSKIFMAFPWPKILMALPWPKILYDSGLKYSQSGQMEKKQNIANLKKREQSIAHD